MSRKSVSDRELRLASRTKARGTPWIAASPAEVARRILAYRFGDESRADPEGNDPSIFELADFQEDAVRRAERILEAWRGVLISDDVGLGKTYVALALIERTLRAGGRVAVITPAALRRDWTAPLRKLRDALGLTETWGLGAEGSTDPDDPGNFQSDNGITEGATGPDHRTRRRNGGFLAWLSHTRLSLGTYPADRLTGLDLVVVDEAHAFRTPTTRRYRALAAICSAAGATANQTTAPASAWAPTTAPTPTSSPGPGPGSEARQHRGPGVVLITATPVNNSVWDLYFLLRLFAGDDAFHDLGIADLAGAFRAAAEMGETGPAPRLLLPVLHAIMIRRSRATVRQGAQTTRCPGSDGSAMPRFPRRAPPVPVHYDLDRVYPAFYDELTDLLTSLTLAPFRLASYGARLTRGGDDAPTDLIRLGLLKRLESSLAAFRTSVTRQLRFYTAFLDSLDRGLLRAPADHRALTGESDGDVVQLVLEEVTLRPLPTGIDLDRLRADTAADLERLHRLLSRIAGLGPDADPKLHRLRTLLDDELRGEKVVVFTEFRTTARYLWRELLGRGHVALIDGAGARLGQARAGRREIIERFAPLANGAGPPPRRERVDLLIATDVLAEGLNLQDANRVVLYDLPWNPVRLIQRIGRLDRLGSPHETVHSYHFLPDRGLERLLGIVARLRAKLGAIDDTVGTEPALPAARADDAGELSALVDRIDAGDTEALVAIERDRNAPFELEERLRAAYRDTAEEVGAPGRDGLPPTPAAPALAAAMVGPPGSTHRVLAAFHTGNRLACLSCDPDGGNINFDDAGTAGILLHALETAPASPLPPDDQTLRRALRTTRRALDRMTAKLAPPPPPNSPVARAARTLLRTLAAVPGGPDPALCQRADRILATLSRSHDAGTEARLVTVLRNAAADHASTLRSDAAAALVAALEAALPPPTPPQPATTAPAAPRLIALLEIRPLPG